MDEVRFVVALADACSDPGTVMVVNRDAGIANAAMEDARRLYYFASWTDFAVYSNVGNVFEDLPANGDVGAHVRVPFADFDLNLVIVASFLVDARHRVENLAIHIVAASVVCFNHHCRRAADAPG